VEVILDGAATHLVEMAPAHGSRAQATHALWICACVTTDDAPTWLIYETVDGEMVWGRIPDATEFPDLVNSKFSTGGHADPGAVLDWLQGKDEDLWGSGDGWGDGVVLERLGSKLRRY
jgi:hypothetical protein